MRQESWILSKHLPRVPAPSGAAQHGRRLEGRCEPVGPPREVPAQVPRGAVSGPASLHILINYLERRGLVNSKLIKFSDDANLGGFRKTGKGRGNINGSWMG